MKHVLGARLLPAGALALATVLMSTGAAAAAGGPPITLPASPKGLKAPVKQPAKAEQRIDYQPQSSCNPSTMPGVAKVRALVLKTYGIGGAGNTARGCTEGLSEHSEGRAWDWMVDVKKPAERRAAANLIGWLTKKDGANAKRLGVMYVIYNKKIWGAYRPSDGWRPSYDHVDHVHLSFTWNGAWGNTSFWKGKVMPTDLGPCKKFEGKYAQISTGPRTGDCAPTSALLRRTDHVTKQYGSTGADVKDAQKLLGVKRTGTFDATTWRAVKAFQYRHDIPRTGVLDQPTWGALDISSRTYDAAAGVTSSRAADVGLSRYTTAEVRLGRAGRAVLYAQRALGMASQDTNGFFGRRTEAAVKRLQKANGLKQTGRIGKAEWSALAR